jgi:GNAT superfamily N-acetyltransferase
MQVPGLQLQVCTENEIPTILRVAIQSYREHYTYLWTDKGENYIASNFTPEILTRELQAKKSHFYVVQLESEPVGFFKLNDEKPSTTFPATDCLELERIYLLQKVAGKGIGKQVLKFVMQVASERNRSIVWLKAMDSSPAKGFYERMGFTGKDTYRLDFPFMKDEHRKIVVMEKSI